MKKAVVKTANVKRQTAHKAGSPTNSKILNKQRLEKISPPKALHEFLAAELSRASA